MSVVNLIPKNVRNNDILQNKKIFPKNADTVHAF